MQCVVLVIRWFPSSSQRRHVQHLRDLITLKSEGFGLIYATVSVIVQSVCRLSVTRVHCDITVPDRQSQKMGPVKMYLWLLCNFVLQSHASSCSVIDDLSWEVAGAGWGNFVLLGFAYRQNALNATMHLRQTIHSTGFGVKVCLLVLLVHISAFNRSKWPYFRNANSL